MRKVDVADPDTADLHSGGFELAGESLGPAFERGGDDGFWGVEGGGGGVDNGGGENGERGVILPEERKEELCLQERRENVLCEDVGEG